MYHVSHSCVRPPLVEIILLLCLWRPALSTGSPASHVTWCQRWDSETTHQIATGVMAAGNYMLPPPAALDVHGENAGEKWKRFRRAWDSYALATGLSDKPENVQVATLLTVIGEEARDVYSTFAWATAGDSGKIDPVLEQFRAYCEPHKNIPFERYKFNRRCQEAGESYEQYRTALRQLAANCEFGTITPDELLRDRLVFGIRDHKTRERLLREPALTLARADEICRAAESTGTQLKVVGDTAAENVSAVNTSTASHPECPNCGRQHDTRKKEQCPAFGKYCRKCKKRNHFAVKCRSKQKKPGWVRTVDEKETIQDTDDDEVYPLRLPVHGLDDSQLVTLRLQSGCYIRFQVDTGAQCNVLPLRTYQEATGDVSLRKVSPIQTKVTAYGGGTLPVVGSVKLKVWRGKSKHHVYCKLIDSNKIRPLLGRKACLGMGVVTYLDNDQLHKPDTGDAPVFAVDDTGPVSVEQLKIKHPKVFGPGVGRLEGKYRIVLDKDMPPVQDPPRRVPVPLRDALKDTLDDLVRQDILAPVQQPTPWISSLVVVPKKDGKPRICLDPKHLNKAIRREHYPLPTIEDVATRLHGARVFTVMDVCKGFWHVELEEDSSFLTTFNTPFGRYRWRRMPFGISSAPEIFQRRIHELIEGLQGVEVVADDFVVVGFGKTVPEATRDHDRNLEAFLRRCAVKGVKLNSDKIKLRQSEVPFIGHVATSEGLRADPNKVKAVNEMPRPTDVAGVQRLLGMSQYLAKFLPHLSDLTKPLRELTHKEVEWVWDQPQERAFKQLQEAITSTPVLRYYNLAEDATIQCDASQAGLGAALMQGGQPVAYASRALTEPETRYAQIEKELLAIVFACNKFDAYIYGRDLVHVESDHQPLESIMQKPLNDAPKRLQRMLLQLQKYTLRVRYKKGTLMHLADTLSRAFLPESTDRVEIQQLEHVDHLESLAMTPEDLQRLRRAAAQDVAMQELRHVIHKGWPATKAQTPEAARPYFPFREQMTVQDELVFRGQQVVIPAALRQEMMATSHAAHIGVEGCLRRARDSMYWPRMSADLKDYISRCDICLTHQDSPQRETLLQHEITSRPWAKAGADLCDLEGRTLLIVCDYFSGFIEVERLRATTSAAVIKALKALFARYGVPDTIISDNGPQFASAEFKAFATRWCFQHVTSSPRYPQANGKVENAVRTIKRLFTKCQHANQSEYRALLDWRNTPTEGVGSSPAQRFLGRRCRTLLPLTEKLLTPEYDTSADYQALSRKRAKQALYYNQHARDLPPLSVGEIVRMRLPGEKQWTSGTCVERHGPRSYIVRVGEAAYRRNRRHLLKGGAQPSKESEIPQTAGLPPDTTSSGDESQTRADNVGPHADMGERSQDPVEETQPAPQRPATPPPPSSVRRSSRLRKSPDWITSYVPS